MDLLGTVDSTASKPTKSRPMLVRVGLRLLLVVVSICLSKALWPFEVANTDSSIVAVWKFLVRAVVGNV